MPPDTTPPGSATPGPGFVPPKPVELDALLPDYDVTDQIGAGGMGAVYRGVQKKLERPVAIKVMAAHVGEEYDFAGRFEREAKAMARLSHNNIVGVIDYGELGLRDATILLYFIMEFVEGTDLHQLIRAGLTPAQALPIISQVCDALHYAHGNGIIHRDIKPANILVDKEGNVKVADFGLAKVEAGPGATSAISMVSLGTPDYAAPEVFVEGSLADHRADIYSLGVMIYEVLTGQVPRGRFASPSVLNPELNPRLDKVVEKAMAQDRDQRFQKVSEVSSALAEARRGPKLLTGTATRAPKLDTARQTVKPPTGAAKGATARQAVEAKAPVAAAAPVAQPAAPAGHVSPAKGGGSRAWIWATLGGVGAIALALFFVINGDDDPGAGDGGGGEVAANNPPPPEGGGTNPPKGTGGGGAGKDPGKPPIDNVPETPFAEPVNDPKDKLLPGLAGSIPGEEIENALGMKLCWIPPGKFTMGSPESEEGRNPVEEAQVDVELTRGFWMGKYEVTQGKWEAMMGASLRDQEAMHTGKYGGIQGEGEDHPMYHVSWEEAVAFCAKLTESEQEKGKLPEGWVYSLPTEAQWEYACRAGNEGSYSGGELDELGWYEGNSGGTAHEVGQKKANAWGLHDMHGNVWEWCADWYVDKPRGGKDPAGPPSGTHRAFRGGGWIGTAADSRSAHRSWGRSEKQRNSILGFRVCLKSTTGTPPRTDPPKPADPPVAVTPDPPVPADPEDEVAARLAELGKSFQARYAKDVDEAHSGVLKTLDGQFAGALKRAEDSAATAGKLDDVVVIRKEAEQIAAGEGVPDEDAEGTPEALVNLRKTYRAQVARLEGERDARAKPLFDAYVKALRDYEVELTRAKDIDAALRVKAFRGEVETKGAEVAARVAAAVPPKGGGSSSGSFGGKKGGEEMENALGMKLCWIPPGKFTMGSPEDEEGRQAEKEAQVEVELTGGFWMGKYEVTQGEWEEVMGSNPANFKDSGKRAPVEQVSWDDAVAFCAKLTESERKAGKLPEGWAYTLPTEAQWEYACRAGEEGPRSGGTLDEVGWYNGNSGGKTHEVGQKKANGWGLHDVHGNVNEWCADWYADELPGGKDPAGSESGSGRVRRGGNWLYDASGCRAADRAGPLPSARNANLGFRVCLSSTK